MNTHLRVQPRCGWQGIRDRLRLCWCQSSMAKGCCSRCVRCLVARGDICSKIQDMVADVKQVESQLRELIPSSGAYFKVHRDFFWHRRSRPDHSLMCRHRCGEDWKYTFFGDYYATLKLIKDNYDPTRLFVAAEGVRSEDWDPDLRCRL